MTTEFTEADLPVLTPHGFTPAIEKAIKQYALAAVAAYRKKLMEQEPVAHIYPSDLERFKNEETFAHAYSVAVVCSEEKSVPLYAAPMPPANEPEEAVVTTVERKGGEYHQIAIALNACDWSGVPIGNKAILQRAISLLQDVDRLITDKSLITARAVLAGKSRVHDSDPDEDAYVIDRMGRLLAGVALALKGQPPARHQHSYHDLPDLVASVVAELAAFKSQTDGKICDSELAGEPGAKDKKPKCATCKDWGLIGGPSFYQPDEGGVPCPDCSEPEPPKQAQAMDEREAFTKWVGHRPYSLPVNPCDAAREGWQARAALAQAQASGKAAPSDADLIAIGKSVGLGEIMSVHFGRALLERYGNAPKDGAMAAGREVA